MDTNVEETKKKRGCLPILGIVLITVLISVAASYFIFSHYLFPKEFDSVELSQHEESVLNNKLRQFGLPVYSGDNISSLEPEAYSEENVRRDVSFSEKELNAILAKNTDLSDKIAIDLSEDLASVKMIIPLDPEFPILGGKTLKINAGAEFSYENGRPIVILKGVSLWGVAVPNAWLGNLKNVDLVKEFGGSEGFWKSFSEGVENISIENGELQINLKE